MIPLDCGPEPAVLAANAATWNEEYDADIKAGNKPKDRYNHDEIKDALREETRGKCAYCESKIEHVSYSHIEHILPKSVYTLLVCEWTNLTLACPVCNTNKGPYYSAAAPLLDPYHDDVESLIFFLGPLALDRNDVAKLTISKLKLNRKELLFQRGESIQHTLKILELIAKSEDKPAIKESLLDDLREKLDDSAEYTSCVRYYVRCDAPERGIDLVAEGIHI